MTIEELEDERRDLITAVGNLQLEIDVQRHPTVEQLRERDNMMRMMEAVEKRISELLSEELKSSKGHVYSGVLSKFAELRNASAEKAKPTFDRYYKGYFEELYENGIRDADSIWMLINKHM